MRIKGSHLRAMRIFAGKTTVKLGTVAGLKGRKTYENWEKNVGTPGINQFIAIATECGLDVMKLFEFIISNHSNTQFNREKLAPLVSK